MAQLLARSSRTHKMVVVLGRFTRNSSGYMFSRPRSQKHAKRAQVSRTPMQGKTWKCLKRQSKALWILSPLAAAMIYLVCSPRPTLNEDLLERSHLPYQRELQHGSLGPVLVSYSYYQVNEVQRANLDFFLTMGMGIAPHGTPPQVTDFVVVVNGNQCQPCSRLNPMLREVQPHRPTLVRTMLGNRLALLWREANIGMDFGAHNETLEWLASYGKLGGYKYFIFLNSSVRGPFVPSYMPDGWQWTQAYTDRLRGKVKAVASSLVCLPEADPGGYGPKLESWAFALDQSGLQAALQDGVFEARNCKLCSDGIVVKGEYGVTYAIMRRGYLIDTLMSKYKQVDWRDPQHWRCNNNVHPSRHGTYDSISMHPLETVFVKASWHVGEPFLDKYSEWMMAQAGGEDTTGGRFDEEMYFYAISQEAQMSSGVGACYDVLHRSQRRKSSSSAFSHLFNRANTVA